MKLFKLIFMVRFIKVSEQVWPIEEGATIRLVPMRAVKPARKINKDWLLKSPSFGCHKVYISSDSLLNVN